MACTSVLYVQTRAMAPKLVAIRPTAMQFGTSWTVVVVGTSNPSCRILGWAPRPVSVPQHVLVIAVWGGCCWRAVVNFKLPCQAGNGGLREWIIAYRIFISSRGLKPGQRALQRHVTPHFNRRA